jgi:hypothetical protein
MKVSRILLLVVSLWGVYFIRAHHILALPAFVDESLHILRAQIVFDFSDALASFLPGKLLTYYYFALFQPQNHNGLWITRQAIALLAPVSAALSFAITRQLTRSYWAGILVIGLYALSPFMLFFERMALADPLALVFGLGLIWVSIQLARKPSIRRAVFAGLLLGLALLAKLTALPLAMVPPLAILLFGELDLKPIARRLVICYVVTGALLLLPMVYVVYQEVAQIENKPEVVTTGLFIPQNQSRLEQIRYNFQGYDEGIEKFGEPLRIALIFVPLGIALRWREGGYIAVSFLGILGFIVLVSAFPSTRYLTLGFPLLLILIGIAVHACLTPTPLQRERGFKHGLPSSSERGFKGGSPPSLARGVYSFIIGSSSPLERGPGGEVIKKLSLLVMAGLGVWFVVFSLGFIRDTWQDPSRHDLRAQDEWEYFSHTSAGYTQRAAAQEIMALASEDKPVAVMGAVGVCHSLRFYFPEGYPIKLYCPYFVVHGIGILLTEEEWKPYAVDGYYLLFEDLNEPNLENILPPSNAVLIGTYPRPNRGVPTLLYEVKADG